MSTLKTITFIRPSGSSITLANTKEMKRFAKDHGFKIKKEKPQLELGGENGNSSAGSEGDTPGDIGTGN